jgi:hypothetical protein
VSEGERERGTRGGGEGDLVRYFVARHAISWPFTPLSPPACFRPPTTPTDSNGHMSLNALATLGIGAFAGGLTALVTYPVDVTRRRLQIQSQYVDPSKRLGALEHINRIIRIEGTLGLYRGITPELLKVVPFVGTMFGVYEILREYFNLRNG